MWQDKIKEIIYLLDNSDVNEIDVTFWGRRFRVVKSAVSNNENEVPSKTESVSVNSPQIDTQKNEPLKSSSDENILSPMPGTFYAAPTPEAEAFVKSGDIISKGDTLCIIEAMKIMNEIEAEKSGKITEIVAKNGEPVEFNQTLFIIDPT
ncbi:MAG: acetyl-CoA carboxylase, biotin carboxyl carrier protein [Candidatus Marinimicrobia bacterium]|nr:acetyl-CoA carboxylase, biotin carboxyl carrier protein [Candidatus Neomarinimicrobiota bacterium]|tara:strand:- start:4362 stop:4811 length:450 start_codon:yes stop_codon:yes gene_type:complete